MDLPLNQDGLKQGIGTGKQLANLPITLIVTSNLDRARQTAAMIHKLNPAMPTIMPVSSLRPWNLGELTGMRVREITGRLRHYMRHPDVAVPGGESYGQFFSRWKGGLERLMELAERAVPGQIVGVTHSRNMGALDAALAQLNEEGDYPPRAGATNERIRILVNDRTQPGEIVMLKKYETGWTRA
jgi:broad specificity phosphatase PhoE